jgi:nicotinamide riboside transporter PnuC
MIPRYYIFWGLLFLTCGYALWRGRSDERIVASVCLLATLATRFAVSPLQERYTSIETGLMAIDALVLVAFVWIALRSERFWPLWIAGLQLTNSISHAMKLAEFDLVPRAYATAAAFWSYPILLILAVGTWRGHQRARQERGAPADPS